jgi:hypothetical protein
MRLQPASRLLHLARSASVLGAILLGGIPAAASELTPVHYIVFEVDPAGAARPVFATRVAMHGSPASVRAGRRAAATERTSDIVDVKLRDAAGRVVFQTVAGLPRFVRGEFHGAGGATIDGHYIPQRNRAFAVRVPSIADTVLELSSSAFAQPSRLTLDSAPHQLPMVTQGRSAAVATLPGWSNGDPANRVDVLVVGDGYTAEEEARFNADTAAVIEGMFSISPYYEYQTT